MKNISKKGILISVFSVLLLAVGVEGAKFFDDLIVTSSIKVGAQTAPDASSIVDLESTSGGFLPPRMTTAQRDAISTPATGLVLFNTDDNELQTYDSVGWVSAGGGAGSGRTNHLSGDDSTFKNSVGNWTDFADAAASTPDDMTGGSPARVSSARNTTTALGADGADLKISHDGVASGQGEGVSIDVTARIADKGLVQEIEFEYQTDTAYADDDLEIWVYDVTNTSQTQPTPFKLKATQGLPNKFQALFQAASDSTSYRVGFYRASSATPAAFDVQVENVIIGPPTYSFGVPSTDSTEYDLVIGAATTPPTKATTTLYDKAYWWRVGDKMYIQYTYSHSDNTGSAAGSGTYYFPIPSGYTIDTDKVRITTNFYEGSVGIAAGYDGSASWDGRVEVENSTNLRLIVSNATTGPGSVSSTRIPLNSATVRLSFTAVFPITGWSSNVRMSDDAGSRLISARWYLNGAQTINTGTATPIDFDLAVYDTHGAGSSDGTEWTYIIPEAGIYSIKSFVQFNDAIAFSGTTELIQYTITKNGSTDTHIYSVRPRSGEDYPIASGAADVEFEAGDVVRLSIQQTSGSNLPLFPGNNTAYVTIHKKQGPSAIAASEIVAAIYTVSASSTNLSIAHNTLERIDFDLKEKDTHGAVTTGASWVFTAPRADTYCIEAMQGYNSLAVTATDFIDLYLNKNGSSIVTRRLEINGTNAAFIPSSTATRCVDLIAGDTISADTYQVTSGGAETLSSSGGFAPHISIYSVGGVH